MAENLDIVCEIADALMEEAGFIQEAHIEKAGQHVSYKTEPDKIVKAIIIGCVYIGQIMEQTSRRELNGEN